MANDLSSRLKKLPCLHNWKVDEVFGSTEFNKIKIQLEKDEDRDMFDAQTYYSERFSKYLILAYGAFKKSDMSDSMKFLEYCYGILNEEGDIIPTYKKAYEQVILAFKAHIYYEETNFDMCLEVAELATRGTNNKIKCFLLCIQAHVMIRLHLINDNIITLMEQAIEYYPDEAECHFLWGYILSRLRHKHFPIPIPMDVEISHLTLAYRLNRKRVGYGIFLARTLSDLYKSTKKKNKYLKEKIMSIINDLLKNVNDLKGTTLARCLWCFWNCNGYQPTEGIEEYISAALTKGSDNNMVNHFIGVYYLKNMKYEKAYKCLSCALNGIPYLMGIVLLLKFRLKLTNDLNNFIQDICKGYTTERDLWNIYCGVAEYFFLVCEDLEEAAHYLLLALKMDNIQKYYISVSHNRKFCLQEVFHNEIQKLSNNNVSKMQQVLTELPAEMISGGCSYNIQELKNSLF